MAYTQQTPIGTPDFNLITKTLAGLQPDSALQQYAQLHKNNPYILSLAKSESDRRKSLRTAAQGNPGQMPTVADREIAGMATPVMTGSGGTLQTGYGGPVITGMASGGLPEDQGIAQLPTPNMQRMADGGIAGYEDDEEGMATGGMGGMFNFAQQSEPVVRMSGGGAVQKFAGKGESLVRTTDGGKTWTLDIPKTIRDPSVPYYREIPNPAAKLADMKFSSREAALEAATTASTKFSSARGAEPYSPPVGAALPTVSNTYDATDDVQRIRLANRPVSEIADSRNRFGKTEQTATFQGPNDPITPRFQPGVSDAPVPPAPAAATSNVAAPPAAAPPDVAPPAAGGVADLLPAVPKLNTSFKPAAAPTVDEAVAQGDKFFNSKARINEINRQVLQEQMDANTVKENSIEALAAFNKKQGPAYEGYEQTLKKEELQDATDKEKAGLMALFKGFLGVAAGESPNAAVNIAKGALLGVDDYNVAMKDLKKSAKERNKEFQFIQQARRAEERGDFDKVQMYEDKASTARQASARFGLAAINDITNAGGKASADIYQNLRTITSNENIAGAREAGLNTRFMAEQTGLNARAVLGENRADARAQMLTGDARTALMLGTGNTQAERLKSGMAVLQELSTDKSGAKTVETLAKINADRAKNGEAPISMADLVASAREYSALMYPKVGNDAPTRER
jgi:hypothetical protein